MRITGVFRLSSLSLPDLVGADGANVHVLRDYRYGIRGGYVDGTAYAFAGGVYNVAGRLPLKVIEADGVATGVGADDWWVPAGAAYVRGLTLPWQVIGLFDVYGSRSRCGDDITARRTSAALVVPALGAGVALSGTLIKDARRHYGLLLGRYARLPLVRTRPILF